MVMHPKNYFSQLFWKFFFEKIVVWKIFKPNFLPTNLYWFLSPDTPFPSKWSSPPTNGFSQFFYHKVKNIHEVFLLESILIRKKILWRLNLLFTKFLLNTLLFEKVWNECKNPSFLHKVTCIRLDHTGIVAKLHIHGFIL